MSAQHKFNSSSSGQAPGSEALTVSTDSGVAQGTILTRTLHINITGTLTNLAMAGPSGGTWKLVDGKQIGVFGMGSEVDTQVSQALPCRLSSSFVYLLTPCL
jgi:hypothetical protein